MRFKRILFLLILPCVLLMTGAISNYTKVLAEAYQNYNYIFKTVNGTTITSSGTGMKATLLIFGSTESGNTQDTLNELSKSMLAEKTDVRVVYIDVDQHSKDEVTRFSNSYSSNFNFCYDTDTNAWINMWSYCELYGISDSVHFPVITYIDGSNQVEKVTTGYDKVDIILGNIQSFADISYASPVNAELSVTGTINYDYVNEVAKQVNQERAKEGNGSLILDQGLTNCATQRAYEIAMYYSHTRPTDESCFTILEGYSFSAAGENIAVGYRSPADVMKGWMNSPGHRANILNTEYKAIGIGAVKIGDMYWWVQLFTDQSNTVFTQTGTYKETRSVEIKPSWVNICASNDNSMMVGGSQKVELCNINKGFQQSIKVTVKDAVLTSSSGAITVSGNTITAKKVGKANILFSSKSLGIDNKKIATVSVTRSNVLRCKATLSYDTCTYDGRAKRPKVVLKNGDTVLTRGTDYTLSYKNNVNPGKATITIKGIGAYKGTLTRTFSITLATPKIKATAGTKKVTLKWNKVKGAKGYIIYRSTKKKGSYSKVQTVTSGSKVSYSNTKLKSKTTYYYKVKAYRVVNGKRVYSNYSSIVSKKTK